MIIRSTQDRSPNQRSCAAPPLGSCGPGEYIDFEIADLATDLTCEQATCFSPWTAPGQLDPAPSQIQIVERLLSGVNSIAPPFPYRSRHHETFQLFRRDDPTGVAVSAQPVVPRISLNHPATDAWPSRDVV